eukprot:747245-Hanusia_phi.AAC.2
MSIARGERNDIVVNKDKSCFSPCKLSSPTSASSTPCASSTPWHKDKIIRQKLRRGVALPSIEGNKGGLGVATSDDDGKRKEKKQRGGKEGERRAQQRNKLACPPNSGCAKH